MTIHEIENTLQTLCARHPTLDEKMLGTLLLSSGWEEKTIKEAILLFKNGNYFTQVPLPAPVDNSHLLQEHNETPEVVEVPVLLEKTPVKEIVQPAKVSFEKAKTKEIKIAEIPNNLPVKPFDSTNHILSFSKYKNVFFDEPIEKNNQPDEISEIVEDIFTSKVPVTREDKGLVTLAVVMLALVLLILSYMHTHGRV